MIAEKVKPASIIIVGFRPTTVDGLENYIEKPSPPGNYKKEDTIQKWLQEELPTIWRRIGYEAAFCKFTGRLFTVYAVDIANKKVFHESLDGETSEAPAAGRNLSREFVRWLRDNGHDLTTVVLLGFNIKKFARLSGIEAMLGAEYVPREYWYQGAEDRTIEPYETLVEQTQRPVFTLKSLLSLVEIEYPAEWQMHLAPKTDAAIAAKLAYRFGLVEPRDLDLSFAQAWDQHFVGEKAVELASPATEQKPATTVEEANVEKPVPAAATAS